MFLIVFITLFLMDLIGCLTLKFAKIWRKRRWNL